MPYIGEGAQFSCPEQATALGQPHFGERRYGNTKRGFRALHLSGHFFHVDMTAAGV